MSTAKTTKDEELDQRIARIRKQNEEILKRKQQIEEDRKFAEQMNAVVQLRPNKDDWPRERTPALKPSNREMRDANLKPGPGGDNEHMASGPVRRNLRQSNPTRNRGDHSRGDPPPDPVSFLADPERDNTSKDKDQQTPTRDMHRNVREFRRDGPRRGRGRGRGSFSSGSFSSPNDDAWREERYKIDEARVSRQKGADGKWRREWDNEKVDLEISEDHLSSGTNFSEVQTKLDWKTQPRDTRDTYEPPFRGRGYPRGDVPKDGYKSRGRGYSGNFDSKDYRDPSGKSRTYSGAYEFKDAHVPSFKDKNHREGFESKDGRESNFRGRSFSRRGTNSRGGMGKGNYEVYPEQSSPSRSGSDIKAPLGSPPVFHDDHKTRMISPSSPSRIITNVGDSFKVVVPNFPSGEMGDAKDSRPSSAKKRYRQEMSKRSKPRTSQSSYSGEEGHRSDSDKEQNERKLNQQPRKPLGKERHLSSNADVSELVAYCKSEKPPLPPFKTSLPKSQLNLKSTKDFNDGEESWEDVTTSGTESIGDDYLYTLSPNRTDSLNPEVEPSNQSIVNSEFDDVYTPDDFIKLVSPCVNPSSDSLYDVTESFKEQLDSQASDDYRNNDKLGYKSDNNEATTLVFENLTVTCKQDDSERLITGATILSAPENIPESQSNICSDELKSNV